jgi:virulence-associated protein VagC
MPLARTDPFPRHLIRPLIASSGLERISRMDILSPVSSETVVFKVGNSLAVRLVGDCRLPRGTRVRERWEGKTIVIEPVVDTWSAAFLASAGTWDEPMERPGRHEPARDPFA